MASDGVSRHMGAWTSCRVVTYASIRLSLSATTPWDEDEGSTLRGKSALGPREVARRHGILSPDSPIHGKLFVYAVCRCLEAGRARVVSIAPPLPMSTEVAGEKGSWMLLARGHYL